MEATELPEVPVMPPPTFTQEEWLACHGWIKRVRQDDRLSRLEHAVLDTALTVTLEFAYPVGKRD